MDRANYYFRQKVTEAELDLGFTYAEDADRAVIVDAALVGVISGMQVIQRGAGANMSVDITAGVAYDKAGQRIEVVGTQNVDVSEDEDSVSTAVVGAPNSKVISIFAKFARVLTDPRTDGNSVTVYHDEAQSFEFVVRQGAEDVAPTPTAADVEMILLADITVIFGQASILDADIELDDRREDVFVQDGATYSLREGTTPAAIAALLDNLNAERAGENARIAARMLAGPVIDEATITDGTIDGADITDGTIAGAAITGGTLAGATVGASTVTSLALVAPVISGVPVITAVQISCTGDAKQKVTSYLISGTTANATPTQLFSWGTILDEAVTTVTAEVQAVIAGGATTADWAKKRRFKRDGGTTTAGTLKSLDDDIEAAFAACVVEIDNSTNTGRVMVTGIAATTITWGAIVTVRTLIP